MGFLRRWLALWRDSPRPSHPEAGRPLGPGEPLARVAFSKSDLRRSAGRLHWAAFDPGPAGRLSCIHVAGLAEREIWDLTLTVLAHRKDRDTVHGRGDFHAGIATDAGLLALRDDDPFERHCELKGWPIGVAGKSERMLLAKRLAATAVLHMPTSPLRLS